MTSPTERKFARAILSTLAEIQITPRDNQHRFNILEKRLKKQVQCFRDFTGRDTLGEELTSELFPVGYGKTS